MEGPPLANIRVLEFAGLAPVPFAGLILADYGASVLRIDRPSSPSIDVLGRRKASIIADLKSPASILLIKNLVKHVDVILDPYRPGVLEKAGLGPDVLLEINPRLIIARLTGFRRSGKFSSIAGHDLNYIGLSGALSLLKRKGERPFPPSNLLGDFAGGGLTCVLGIILALFSRTVTGKGQVVEANMVDGSGYLTTWSRMMPLWDDPDGGHLLDGNCPWYRTYETKDGKHMAAGPLEPHFYDIFVKALSLPEAPPPRAKENWPALTSIFEKRFKEKTRDEWEEHFKDLDACVTPVLDIEDVKARGIPQQLPVHPLRSPGLKIASESDGQEGSSTSGKGFEAEFVQPGEGGQKLLEKWCGWKQDVDFSTGERGEMQVPAKSKL